MMPIEMRRICHVKKKCLASLFYFDNIKITRGLNNSFIFIYFFNWLSLTKLQSWLFILFKEIDD